MGGRADFHDLRLIPLSDLPAPLAAALRDRYTFERELGRGGMATVFLAQDLKHKRPVALKVLRPELAASLGAERFQREIEIAARLQHPHILTVLDSGEAAGQLWFTMPFVEGESLRARIQRDKQLRLEDALRVAREVAEALGYAHEHGIIHRDVKPENILLTRDGNTLVAATERKTLPVKDVAAAGGWKDVTTLIECYQQPDDETLRAVVEFSKPRAQAWPGVRSQK